MSQRQPDHPPVDPQPRALYDPHGVRAYFDASGPREWERLECSLQGRIKYAIHRRFLDHYVPAGASVLDAGCGPGRFALDLAQRGARVTLVDISSAQLELARQHLAEAGLLDRVDAILCLDMVAMPTLAAASFDVVVCYGAALSYTYDRYAAALAELVRVLRPGGRLLISVDSLYGTLRLIGPYDAAGFLEQPDAHLDWAAATTHAGVVCSRPGSKEVHQPLALFTSNGLCQTLMAANLHVLALACANPLVPDPALIPCITANEQSSAALTALELALCTCPGLLEAGEHLLAVAEKPPD